MTTPSPESRNTLELMTALLWMLSPDSDQRPSSIQFDLPNHTRVITNRPLESVLDRFTNLTPEMKEQIKPRSTGGYDPRLLDSIKDLEYEVHVESVPRTAPVEIMPTLVARIKERASNSSFSFIEGGDITTVFARYRGERVSSWSEFARILGVEIGNSTKIGKRLKELFRLTPYFVRLPRVDVRFIESDYPDIDPKHVDGVSLIRKSLALKMAPNAMIRKMIHTNKIVRVSFRCISPDGLIKGDALIVDNKRIDSDIYTSVENLKDELHSKLGYVVTMEPHHAHRPARTDDQTMSWWPSLFPLEQMTKGVEAVLNDVYTSLENGDYPFYMITQGDLKKGADQVNIMQSLSNRWLAHSMEINHSAALVAQAGGAIKNQLLPEPPLRMGSDGVLRPDYSRQKIRIPIVWAFYGHIMTDTIIKLAGYDVPEDAVGKLFFHSETGSIVIPAEHFAAYYRNHGGWDLDDAVKVLVRIIDGHEKAILIRSPNSWGEYSILDVYRTDLPLYHTYEDIDVPQLSSNDLPTQIQDLVYDEPDKDRSIPADSFVRDAHYNIADFNYALECALINPGTGSAINLMCIAYYAIFGYYDPDPWAEVEDIVDLTQQNPSIMGLSALSEALLRYQDLLINAVMEGLPVDIAIFNRRLNLSTEQRSDLAGVAVLVEGPFTQLKNMVRDQVGIFSARVNTLALQGRVQLDLSDLDFRPVREAVSQVWNLYGQAVRRTLGTYDPEIKRNTWQNLNRLLVTRLELTEQTRRDLIILGVLNMVYERSKKDTVLFLTPGSTDGVMERSTMDLLLDALVRRGVAISPSM